MSRDFDNVDDLVNCGSGNIISNLTTKTALAWINPEGLGEGNLGRIFNMHNSGGTQSWRFYFTATNRFNFEHETTVAPTSVQRISGTNTFALNVWSHAGVTHDGTTDATGVSFYFNGNTTTYTATTNGGGVLRGSSGGNLIIGNRAAADRTFNGKLAHLHLYNVVLTGDEIRQVMRIPMSVTRGLVGYWPFFSFGSPEGDYTGLGNRGNVTGAIAGVTNPPINNIFYVPSPQLIQVF